jgi:hypothetical protein
MDKIDTQGMSLPGNGNIISGRKILPMPVKKRTTVTPEERQELKDIINETLNERDNHGA